MGEVRKKRRRIEDGSEENMVRKADVKKHSEDAEREEIISEERPSE